MPDDWPPQSRNTVNESQRFPGKKERKNALVYCTVVSHYITASFVRPAGYHTMITLEERTGFFFHLSFFFISSFLPAAPSVSRSSLFPGLTGTPANIQTFQPSADQEKSGGSRELPSLKQTPDKQLHPPLPALLGRCEVAANDGRRFANITHLGEVSASNKTGDARCPFSFFFFIPPPEPC